jgi:hypothetical protein
VAQQRRTRDARSVSACANFRYLFSSKMGASSSVASSGVAGGWIGVRRLAALTTGVVVLLACDAGQAVAQEGSVTFATANPLTLTWGELLHGKSVEICNGGGATVPRLRVVPVDFAFTRDSAAVAPANVLTIAPPAHPLRAGDCAALHVSPTSEAPIDAGEYSGSLLLVAAGHGGSARLAMTLTTLAGKSAAPGGVGEPTSLTIANASPWSERANATLLLKTPASGEEALAIGKSCNQAAPNESDCPVLGNLYQGANVVRVSVDGPARANRDEGVQEVPIALHGFQHPVGTYEGSLVLPGSTHAIKLKLTAKDAWWCAVLALLLGALFALAIQLWNGRWQPRATLEERARALPRNYGDENVLDVTLDRKSIDEYAQQVNVAIAAYAHSIVLFDTTSDAYKAIDASLKLAEEDASVFVGSGGLKPTIEQLDAAVRASTDLLHFLEVSDVPAILKAASELLKGAPLGVGGAKQRLEQAKVLQPALIGWRELACDFMTNVVWLELQTDKVAKDARTKNQPPKSLLYPVGVRMSALRQRLFEVKSADDLAALRASPALSAALARVAYLGQTLGVPRPDLVELRKDAKGGTLGVKSLGKLELDEIGYLSAPGDPFTFKEMLAKPAGVVIEPAKPATLTPHEKRWRRVGDWAILAVTLAISVIAGLSSFYFTKSFGSFTDYLTVIVIGSAAQTLLKAVLNQTTILLHDFAADTPAVPAKVLAPSPARS